ncbi:MAG: hypothetical protein FWF10_07980 [Clostridiales bacterium]|nr:hypothetical protein [Clostridiales bacterium]
MNCIRCGSDRVSCQIVSDVKTKHRGCIGWVFWILLAICTCGLILIIPAITNSRTKTRHHTVALCQSCGKRWRV